LPLTNICATMQRTIDDLISLSPSVHEQVKDK
jgi:putative membrane protein